MIRKDINLVFIMMTVLIYTGCGNSDNLKSIDVSGTIETTEITVASKVSGEIKRLYFDEGDFIKKNDTIAEIDRTNLILQTKQAEGGLLLADAQLKLVLNGSRIEDIRQAEEMYQQAKANLESAEQDKNRMESLFKSNSISEKQWNDIQTKYKVSFAQMNSASEALKKLKRGSRLEDIDAAKARKIQAEAQYEYLKKQLNDCFVLAPTDGLLSHRIFEEGELVMAGSNLFTISKVDKVHLMVYINEENLGKVKIGQKVEIKIDSFKDRIFEGKVIYISSSAEFTPKNIQTKEDRTKLVFGVKVEILNHEKILKPGMPADASIIIAE